MSTRVGLIVGVGVGLGLGLACGAIAQALAPGATWVPGSSPTPAQINDAYDWVCSNRSTIEPIIETIAGLGLLSIPLHIAGALMKKASITKATPWLYRAWTIIRALNADVKPPPAAIVQQAAEIVATTPGVVALSGASPDKIAAAAQVIQTTAKP